MVTLVAEKDVEPEILIFFVHLNAKDQQNGFLPGGWFGSTILEKRSWWFYRWLHQKGLKNH